MPCCLPSPDAAEVAVSPKTCAQLVSLGRAAVTFEPSEPGKLKCSP